MRSRPCRAAGAVGRGRLTGRCGAQLREALVRPPFDVDAAAARGGHAAAKTGRVRRPRGPAPEAS